MADGKSHIVDAMLERLAATVDAGGLLCPGERVLVGVSGGVDSVALLHALAMLARNPRRCYSLIAAHLDHGLRADSAEDAAFVAALAEQLHLSCVRERIEVNPLIRQHGQGIEHAARTARYEFFARQARRENARAVAVAHHADDNAETILFRILRGTGMRGLKGMEAQRRLPFSDREHPVRLIRPFLEFRRAEILSYAQAAGLRWREDSTNQQTHYRRNFLRHNLLPLARRRVNRQADEALLRLGKQAGQVEAWLTHQARERLARAVAHEDSHTILLDLLVFAPDPNDTNESILRTTAYHLILERLGAPQRDLTAEHLAGIDALLSLSEGTVNLPSGFQARRQRNHLLFQKPHGTQCPNRKKNCPGIP